MSDKRISREEMLAQIVSTVAKRSTCNRRQVGALIALQGRILSIGYVGSPPGLPHCHEVGCLLGPDGGCIRTQHAESNVLAFAARYGVRTEGADLWCSLTPCLFCAKMIINSGIRNFYALEPYRELSGADLFMQSGGILHLPSDDGWISIRSVKEIPSAA